MAVITREDLLVAFRKTLGEKGYSEGQLTELADIVITLFGYANSVIDNRLNAKERDVFYRLEEVGLMHTSQEEVSLDKGKIWRLHYWFLNGPKIIQLSRGQEPPKEEADKFSFYLSEEDIWKRGSTEK